MITPYQAAKPLVMMACCLAALLAGCDKKAPEGQVVAVVNGEEVTRRELATEPGAANGDVAQPQLAAMLSGVVDRKLAAAEAKRLELDQTPRFVAQAKRLQEVMLSRTLFDRWISEIPPPQPAAIAAYVAQNPQRFDGRKLFLIDRIETADSGPNKEAIGPLQTNDAIAAYLDAHDQPYRRERAVLDSTGLPLALYRKLVTLPPETPIAVAQGGRLLIVAAQQTRDAPLPPAEKSAAAVLALKQVKVQEKLAALRKTAKVSYQPGYRPSSSDASQAP
ncbi:EpsD family peptidyl-prolyl cis-trans isomerase [Novosphingobium chloroacetimidivorans]|uniref:EpsD family peptidyl-prolyl cis-trans isomerase n=1 Tax=Novosphingobium chloroacetimidivorans TaxID=1428314 RepID=A0A7W7NUN9_9SPHN|nr:hypothetical protein [Novosphingobium chloroacetimidivorans]MBB4857391.1 EpsD family peptidyl-prolyl cis-trans isomerase [Novosphingobium chloroacetimidivorans]